MSVQVLRPGLLTSVQDVGRTSYAEYGVPVSGAMDSYAAKIANLLVGNTPDRAVLEVSLIGPVLKFNKKTLISVAGIEVNVYLNGNKIRINTTVKVVENDVLEIAEITKGARAYVAVSGGWQTPLVLGSRSFYKSITEKSRLEKYDFIDFNEETTKVQESNATVKFQAERYSSPIIEVQPVFEWFQLTAENQTRLLQQHFRVSKNNNRMAYQLIPEFSNHLKGILTQPILPGTVQLTPAGNLIVLMRDAQTTGGYPRVFQLTEESINKLAQKRKGEVFKFKKI